MLLKDYPVTHADVRPVMHPLLSTKVAGRSVVRYMRFMRPVRVDRLELPRTVYGRWVPKVPVHPAHITVSVAHSGRWKVVKDVRIPPDPRIRGEGLSQSMSEEEMEAHFARILDDPPIAIDLGGIYTDHLRVECDREHPVWPNHGETNGGIFNVPFGTLNPLRAFGDTEEDFINVPKRLPPLRLADFDPEPAPGMRVRRLPNMLLYEGDLFTVGFSLVRPMLMHMGWDALGREAGHNRLLASRSSYGILSATGGLSGPVLRTLRGDFPPNLWTGTVSVDGNTIRYSGLHCAVEGYRLDAGFTVQPDGLLIELEQTCDVDLPVLETEAWRLAWDEKAGLTGAAAETVLLPGRSGEVRMPFAWASDRVGFLLCRSLDTETSACFQVESFATHGTVTGGFTLCPRLELPEQIMTLPQGKIGGSFDLRVGAFEPDNVSSTEPMPDGLRRHWGTIFSCYRPEFRGFSNNAISTNCHVSQGYPMEIVAHTAKPESGPDHVALGRFTVEGGLLDGGGYGYWRNLYLDSDPNLVCAAGRLHQARPDVDWLRCIEPGLAAAVERMASNIGDEGLVICRDLSGNSGSHRWSSNAADVIGFGHIDGFVNAWTYRALRNAAALLRALGHSDSGRKCSELADGLRAAYATFLLNPKTGWLAGWRSRDGEYHDHAFIWVNGIAIAFGLLDPDSARRALESLENLRDEVGPASATMGLPLNLLPIPWPEQRLPFIRNEALPTFETYTDGSLCSWAATYYLRALSIYGLTDRAEKIASELEEGYAAGMFHGGSGSGVEFRSWEGMPTAYEGTLIGCFTPVYSIAIQKGFIQPYTPEWWPE